MKFQVKENAVSECRNLFDGVGTGAARAIAALGARLNPDEPLQIAPARAEYDFQLIPIKYGAVITAVVFVIAAICLLKVFGRSTQPADAATAETAVTADRASTAASAFLMTRPLYSR